MSGYADALLALANRLIRVGPRNAAYKRRAVSTAYYAAFHALVEVCADALNTGLDVADAEYEQLYRVIEHKDVSQFKAVVFKEGNESLKEIFENLVKLQDARLRADYFPPRKNVFSMQECREFMAASEEVIEGLKGLPPSGKNKLAVRLLVKLKAR
jgi:uncharacterized protein (UPF0332 family)